MCTAWKFRVAMRGLAARTSSMDMRDMQYGYEVHKFRTDVQHGHAVIDMRHGHAA
jgi:hypothetical protein